MSASLAPTLDRSGAARLEALEITPYCLPMSRPWRSARGLTHERRGWLVRAAAQGVWGFGDCAPLPEAGTETQSEAERALSYWQGRLRGLPLDEALGLLIVPPWRAPAAGHAWECALLDLQSRLAGRPLRCWISPPGDRQVEDWVEVNGILGACLEVSRSSLDELVGLGYRVLKIKMGCGDVGAEVEHLTRIASWLPCGVRLRLDANGAWGLDTAAAAIASLKGLPVESLEEPLRQPDPDGLARLQGLAPFPLALDESLVHWAWGSDPRALPVKRAVIKPAAVGGWRASLDLAHRLRGLGIEVVTTGILDSAAGLWSTAQLAAATGSPLAHGLATADWLAQDLGEAPRPKDGRVGLPRSPGSGFVPSRSGAGLG